MEALEVAMQAMVEASTCPVCLEVTRRCVGLRCGHPLCDICLEAMARAGLLAQNGCPVCRQRVPVGSVFAARPEPEVVQLLVALRGLLGGTCARSMPLLDPAQRPTRRWVTLSSTRSVAREGGWSPRPASRAALPPVQPPVQPPPVQPSVQQDSDDSDLTDVTWSDSDSTQVTQLWDSSDDDEPPVRRRRLQTLGPRLGRSGWST